jgi:hypothetical protein
MCPYSFVHQAELRFVLASCSYEHCDISVSLDRRARASLGYVSRTYSHCKDQSATSSGMTGPDSGVSTLKLTLKERFRCPLLAVMEPPGDSCCSTMTKQLR